MATGFAPIKGNFRVTELLFLHCIVMALIWCVSGAETSILLDALLVIDAGKVGSFSDHVSDLFVGVFKLKLIVIYIFGANNCCRAKGSFKILNSERQIHVFGAKEKGKSSNSCLFLSLRE